MLKKKNMVMKDKWPEGWSKESSAIISTCWSKYCWPQATFWPTMTSACVPAQQMHWRANDSHGRRRERHRSTEWVLLWRANLVYYRQSGLLGKQTCRNLALIKELKVQGFSLRSLSRRRQFFVFFLFAARSKSHNIFRCKNDPDT